MGEKQLQETRSSTSPPPVTALDLVRGSHTASEHKLYTVMLRHERERTWGFKELSGLTGLRSDFTIRKAIDGLIEKLSVEILDYKHGNPRGPFYRTYAPHEIVNRRRSRGIDIDPLTLRVRAPAATGVNTPAQTGVNTGVNTGARDDGAHPAETLGSPLQIEGVPQHDEADDDLYATLRTLLPGEPDDAIRRAMRDLHTILAAFVERAAARSASPPRGAAFFVSSVRSALAAREAIDRIRTAPVPEPSPTQDARPGAYPRELLRAIAHEIRHAAQHDSEYRDDDLRRDLLAWCTEQGIDADPDHLDAAVVETAPKIP